MIPNPLREQIAARLHEWAVRDSGSCDHTLELSVPWRCRARADALIAAVPLLSNLTSTDKPASSDLRAGLEGIRRAYERGATLEDLIRLVDTLLDTAQPDLGRTPDAEAIAEALMEARYPDDGSRQRAAWIKSPAAEVPWSIARRDAAVVVAKLAATPAPAEEELDPPLMQWPRTRPSTTPCRCPLPRLRRRSDG